MILDDNAAYAVLRELLAQVRQLGPGAAAQAMLISERAANTRFAVNEITSTGDVSEVRVQLELGLGRRHAASTTNQTDRASLGALVERVLRMAEASPEDPEYLPPLGPQKYPANTSAFGFDAATAKLDAAARAHVADLAVSRARSTELKMAGFHEHQAQATALMNTAGLRAYFRRTGVNLSLTARTKDGTGSGWAGLVSHRHGDIGAAAMVGQAIDKAVRSAHPKRLEPGRYTVVLEPAAVADLLGFLVRSLDARSADEGRSFFAKPGGGTRLGEPLFGDAMTLTSDPFDPALPTRPFDGDGMPVGARTWIDRGRLAALLYSRYWAMKQGKPATGVPGGYTLHGGTASAADLIAGVKRGVLITRFFYTRWVDPQSMLVTGLTRDGVFLIEDGAVTTPVNNFRFNESPVTMLRNADALTRETVRPQGLGTMRVPALRTHEFNLASISDAV